MGKWNENFFQAPSVAPVAIDLWQLGGPGGQRGGGGGGGARTRTEETSPPWLPVSRA